MNLKQLMTQAFKIKTSYQTVTTAAAMMDKQVRLGGDWDWALDTKFFKELQETCSKLQDNTSAEFVMYILTHTQAELIRKHKEHQLALVQGLSDFVKLEKLIDAVQGATSRLQRMHQSSVQAS